MIRLFVGFLLIHGVCSICLPTNVTLCLSRVCIVQLTLERQEMEESVLPQLKANCDQLVDVFHKIDQIEVIMTEQRDRQTDCICVCVCVCACGRNTQKPTYTHMRMRIFSRAHNLTGVCLCERAGCGGHGEGTNECS